MQNQVASELPTRGVCWVLSRALAALALVLAGTQLFMFVLLLIAEQQLSIAATAGMREATLPRASLASVRKAIAGCLPESLGAPQVVLLQNDAGPIGPLALSAGDYLQLWVAVPSRDVLPRWLPATVARLADPTVHVLVRHEVPRREFPTERESARTAHATLF